MQRRCARCVVWWLVMIACAAHGPARGQSALVLSGGGARGIAHAGVLEVMEELGYDPDLVVGTSMGAIVGALYAAGYTPAEIRARIMAVRWQDLFAPTPVIVGPARETRWPMLTMGLDTREQRVERGLFGVWRINRGLTRLLFDATARSRGDFDRLPRRYRAIAADLKTGAVVVLDSGDIARAVRASMAIPGFFAPLEWDDRVFTDGGIADNLPIGIARRLGAQHVIAVDVSRPTAEITDLAPFTIVQRALDLMQENAQRAARPPDVLILPDISAGVAGTSFPDDPTRLLELGVAAARRDLPPRAQGNTSVPREQPPAPRAFRAVRIEAPDTALAAFARHAFAGIAGKPYDADAVLMAIDRIYSSGLVEAVWTRVVDNVTRDTAPTLVVRIEAPPALTLDAAAGFENDRGGRGWATLTRYIALGPRPLLLAAAASTDGLDRDLSLSATHFLIGRPAIAWSIGGYAAERNVRTFSEDAITTQDAVRAGGWIGLEFPHVLRDRLTTAVWRSEWIHLEDGVRGYSGGPLLRFSSLNPATMIVGVPFVVEAERRWGDIRYTRVGLRGSFERGVAALRLAVIGDVRAVSAAAPFDVWPALGDEHAVPGLRWGQERARGRIVTGLDAAYPIRSGYARLRLRTGATDTSPSGTSVTDRLENVFDSQWMTGARLGIVWRTPLGMLELDYGFNNRGYGRFDLSIGRDF